MKRAKNLKIKYEPEADVLMWEVSSQPIDYAKEAGNMIVHFSCKNVPVLIEILEASKFLFKAENIVERESGLSLPQLARV